ncbi:MAG: hypothetical protein WC635_07690 [Bacteriovorax sp.]|jgi:hypothetical protein
MNQDGIWLSILDYASVKKISISTIRRSIKAGHVLFREESGKYFIWTKDVQHEYSEEKKLYGLKLEIEFLKRQNRELLEELNDIKMLLNVYEGQGRQEQLPPLPQSAL